ncbi:MAG: VWA domain-containing protein [Myxococcota bacterium]
MKKLVRKIGRRGYGIAALVAAVSVGGIVLLKAPSHAVPVPVDGPVSQGTWEQAAPSRSTFAGPQLSGAAALSQGAVLAHGNREVLAEISLRASEEGGTEQRMPVALAVVLDVSGSMSGEKIEQARRSLRQLVERMEPSDQVAIITYNHAPLVRQSLSPVSAVRPALSGLVQEIYASGGTMIPPALELGASSLAAAPANYVRRVVLISDGLDGSGQGPVGVASMVRRHATNGVAMSSLGIGIDYDQTFLTAVADAGRGNYAFLRNGSELHGFLNKELDEAGHTVVDEVVAVLDLPSGWSVAQVIGAETERAGNSIRLPVGPMFRGDQRRVVTVLRVEAGSPGDLGGVGVRVRYRTTGDQVQHDIGGAELALRSVPTGPEVEASRDQTIHARTVAAKLEVEQEQAVQAWRDGDVQRARSISQSNAATLRELQLAAPAAAAEIAPRLEAAEADERNFGMFSAGSAGGRAWDRASTASRRTRSRR